MADLVSARRQGRVGIVAIDRPERRNALNLQVKKEIVDRVESLARDDHVAVIVLTGEGGFFVAGTDIAEMESMRPTDHVRLETDRVFHAVRQCPKAVIAAVEGYALGGGCELALLCDFIIAAEDAQFGQPEIKLGILPGIGGSQRLTRLVGKSLAMDMVLTGRTIGAVEAKASGLVARVVPGPELLQIALEAAHTIAGYNAPAVRLAKEAVNRSQEVSLAEGVLHERRLFQAAFATQGQKEGMHAFLDKRAPVFRHK